MTVDEIINNEPEECEGDSVKWISSVDLCKYAGNYNCPYQNPRMLVYTMKDESRFQCLYKKIEKKTK